MSAWKMVKWLVGLTVLAASASVVQPSMGGQAELKHVVPRGSQDVETPVPLPPPVEVPAEPAVAAPAGIHVVGYTAATTPANRGILNMTRACQHEFPGSRVCTVDEVLASFIVPEVTSSCEGTYVWVQSVGTVASKLFGATLADNTSAVDCHGWTSTSREDLGVVIALGSEHGCYGGIVQVTCNQELALACCAPERSRAITSAHR